MRELLFLLLLATVLGCLAVMRAKRDPLPGAWSRRAPWIFTIAVVALAISAYVRDRAVFSRQIALLREAEKQWPERKWRGPDPLPERLRVSVTIAIPCTSFTSGARTELCASTATHLPGTLSAATREEVRQSVVGSMQLEIRPTTQRGTKLARAPAHYVARGGGPAPELLSDRDVIILRSMTDAVLINRSTVPAFFFMSAEAAIKLEGTSDGYDVRHVVLTTEAGREYVIQPVLASDRDAFVGRLRSRGVS